MVLRPDKARDRAKLQRKKARRAAEKPAWRERHAFETDRVVLARSAFDAVMAHSRPVRTNPFYDAAVRYLGAPRADQKAAAAVFVRAAECGLDEPDAHLSLASLVAWRKRWRRRPQDWPTPRATSVRRRLIAFLRWLVADYDAPTLFAEPFLEGPTGGQPEPGDRRQRWFIDLAQGKSLRRFEDLRFPLTARMAHAVLHAPDDLRLSQAFRWGQVRGFGGTAALADAVVQSGLGDPQPAEREAFWAELVRRLAAEAFFATSRVEPIVRYVRAVRFGDGHPAPPRPSFQLRGRSITRLDQDATEWADHLRAAQRRSQQVPRDATWPPRGFAAEDRHLFELTSLTELYEEGRALGHCIATYARPCIAGRAVVLAYRPPGVGKSTRLTLHVDPRDQRLVEVRGMANRLPTADEWRLLRDWGQTHDVMVSAPE